MTSLEFRNVSFGYGRRNIIHDISFVLDKPELVCVLGPNGVGKTTMVKCINRLLKPQSGEVLVDGRNVNDYRLLDLARIMTYVPNSIHTVFSMNVSEFILMGRHPRAGWTTTDHDLKVVDDAIEAMGLQEYADRDINQLSGGQMQRAMIARGLVQEPEILILDEPTSNLDVKYQMGVMRFFKDYARKKGIIVVMVCHDLNIVASYADRVMLVSEGTLFADGTAEEVMTRENILQVYRVESKIVQFLESPHVMLIPDDKDDGFSYFDDRDA